MTTDADSAKPGKSFWKEASVWLLALPVAAQGLASVPEPWRKSEFLKRVVLERQEASQNFWSHIFGPEAVTGPFLNHQFMTFALLIYVPAIIWLAWISYRRFSAGVPVPNLGRQNDLIWYLVASFGAYWVLVAIAPGITIIFHPLGLAMQLLIAGYLASIAIDENGLERFRKRVPLPLFNHDWADRLAISFLSISIAFTAVDDFRNMTPQASRDEWIAGALHVPFLMATMIAIRFGQRWPGKVFLAGGSFLFVDWVLNVVIPFGEHLLFSPAT